MRDDHFLPAADREFSARREINRLQMLMLIGMFCALSWLLVIAVAIKGYENWQAVNAAHRAEVV